MKPQSPPPNPTNNYVNYLAVFISFVVTAMALDDGLRGAEAAVIAIAAYALPILLFEIIVLRTPWRDSVGLDFKRRDFVPHRITVKLLGVYGSLGFVAFLYWVFPEYHGSYYNPYWAALEAIGPTILVLVVPYTIFMDSRAREPLDSYYWFGKCLLFDAKGVSIPMIGQHLLGWVVKGFFLPLMFVSFAGNISHLSNANFDNYFSDFRVFYRLTVDLLFTLDLMGAVAGYALAVRLFDTHIRSSEPTLFGWLICIMCYQPFLSVYMRYYLAYPDNDWMRWLNDYPVLQVVWGSTALLMLAIYSFGTINFGLRFSNLTHRGVLTKGFYRFTKHPAYVTKNAFWWLTYVPMLPVNGWAEALRYSLLLLGINTVYFLRARTEERHLSRDPDYVQYALYMNDHSMFRGLARRLPFLKYKAPKNWESLPRPYNGIK